MEKERALLAGVGAAAVVLAPVEGLILRALRFGDLRTSLKDGANVALVSAGVWYVLLRVLIEERHRPLEAMLERVGLPQWFVIVVVAFVLTLVATVALSLIGRRSLLRCIGAATLITVVTFVPTVLIAEHVVKNRSQ